MTWREKEVDVAKRMSTLLSPLHLVFDFYLRDLVLDENSQGSGSINTDLKLSKFYQHDPRLKLLTTDEAVIAKSCRQYCDNNEFHISQDGYSVEITQTLRDSTIQCLNQIKDTTFYIENIPSSSTQESIHELFTPFGPVKHVFLAERLKRDNIVVCGWAFVVFEDSDSVGKVLKLWERQDVMSIGQTMEDINHREQGWISQILSPSSHSQNVNRSTTWLKQRAKTFASLSILSFATFEQRRTEYLNLRKRITLTNQKQKESRQITFTPRTTFAFQHVHPNTTSRILKDLFSAYGKCVHVDLTRSSCSGYVRFATPHDAQLVQEWFTKESVFQTHGGCLGVLAVTHKTKHREGIKLRLLEVEEEKEYFQRVQDAWERKTGSSESQPKPMDVTSGDQSQTATHVRFYSSSDEEDSDVEGRRGIKRAFSESSDDEEGGSTEDGDLNFEDGGDDYEVLEVDSTSISRQQQMSQMSFKKIKYDEY